MNELNMLSSIKASEESGARLDFADLLSRIEADGGKSTAPCMMQERSRAGKIIGTAAGIVAVAAISAAALAGIGGAVKMSDAECAMDAAPMAPSEPAESMDSASEFYTSDEDYSFSENGSSNSVSGVVAENTTGSDGETVSDSDVSDSDVSDGDVQEVD